MKHKVKFSPLALSVFIVAIIILIPVMAACAADIQPSDTETTGENNGQTEETTMTEGDNLLDNVPGSLTYTPSEDGKTVSISYTYLGKTHSYTVPNRPDMLFGGYAATDDLGRSLPTSDTVNCYVDGERYVGLFYFLWMGEHGDWGAFDNAKIIASDPIGAKSSTYSGWGPVGAMHFFAEPLYGYYYSRDEWVMRRHVELLTAAGVDFLYVDVTNGFPYISNAKKLMRILSDYNCQGYNAPKVVFYTNSGSADVINTLYDNIYSRNYCPDTWFRIDGKPMIIGVHDHDGYFTVRAAQWPNESMKKNAWPWMDFTWPQRVFRNNANKVEAISISVAQHSGTVCFSDSAIYGNQTNRGRSYDGTQSLSDSSYLYGYNLQAQWDYALKTKAKYLLVTGWNEWVAQRQEPTSQRDVFFVDTCSLEYSRDLEMTRGGYFDNYYLQLISNVMKTKGAAPVLVSDCRKQIDLSGSFDQWESIALTYTDPTMDAVERNCIGFGGVTYKNSTNRNDFMQMKVTQDAKNLYFYAQTFKNIKQGNDESAWMQLWLNTGAEKDGWYGYQYIVNYRADGEWSGGGSTGTSTVVRCTAGTDGKCVTEEIGQISYTVHGKQLMLAVPFSLLEITDPEHISLQFKWADSTGTFDEIEDFYTDGDVAPLGRLNYIYQTFLPGTP